MLSDSKVGMLACYLSLCGALSRSLSLARALLDKGAAGGTKCKPVTRKNVCVCVCLCVCICKGRCKAVARKVGMLARYLIACGHTSMISDNMRAY
jgi:hypothetical protein